MMVHPRLNRNGPFRHSLMPSTITGNCEPKLTTHHFPPTPMLSLNELAHRRCELLAEHLAERLHLHAGVLRMDCGARVIDCGVNASGGLEVGRQLAEICLADLGRVNFVPGQADLWPGLAVTIET